jgi:purine-nucleoside phosphorylase
MTHSRTSKLTGNVCEPTATANALAAMVRGRPRLGLILGSGFGGVARAVTLERSINYEELKGFPKGRVAGHDGQLLIGKLGEVDVIVLAGRAHFYEGFSLDEVTFPIRVLAAFGLDTVLLTNAAGGISPALRAGDFMILRDHINFMGVNPLRGVVTEGSSGSVEASRFTDMTEAYDPELRRILRAAARSQRLRVVEGVYLAVSGPSYETPAEIRAFGRLGASAVGMSTVAEVIVARQCGLRVAALSGITNLAAGRAGPGVRLSHEEVLAQAHSREVVATQLVAEFARRWNLLG